MFDLTPVEKDKAALEKVARCVTGIYALSAQIDGAKKFLDHSRHGSALHELEQFKALLEQAETKLFAELLRLQARIEFN